MKPSEVFAAIIGLLTVAILLSFLLAFPVMWLWNYAVVGTIAGCSALTFWKAWCLMVLCSFLFKGTSVSSKS